MKIRAIIIEDEEPARQLLKKFLESETEIEIAGEFSDGLSGAKAMQELKPDLAFLDIQMPKLNGFEVIDVCEYRPVIIFTTAYDQYALKAFEANATDYLLKPFTRDRFEEALKKAKEKILNKKNDENGLNTLIIHNDSKTELLDRVAIRSGNKIHVIPCSEILYLEADGDYVKIHTEKASHLKEKTMKYFETHFDPKQFARIHRSYIVNVNYIKQLDYYDKESYAAMLKNGVQLKVSSSGYKALKELLKM